MESLSLELASETVIETYKHLVNCYCPTNIEKIHIFCDSQITYNWVNLLAYKFDDLRRRGPLLRNRLNHVLNLSKEHSLHISHICGKSNISDIVSRPYSAKMIKKYSKKNFKPFSCMNLFSYQYR